MKDQKTYKSATLKDNVIYIELADGQKRDANILFTFHENGEQFLMYEIDDVAYGAKVNDDNSLKPIEEDEWELVERIFNQWLEDQDDDVNDEEEK